VGCLLRRCANHYKSDSLNGSSGVHALIGQVFQSKIGTSHGGLVSTSDEENLLPYCQHIGR
jgi:hypothetical protein